MSDAWSGLVVRCGCRAYEMSHVAHEIAVVEWGRECRLAMKDKQERAMPWRQERKALIRETRAAHRFICESNQTFKNRTRHLRVLPGPCVGQQECPVSPARRRR